jgi:hypothetical protein
MIGPIATEMVWTSAWAPAPAPDMYTIDNRFELGRLVGLSWQHCNGEWQSTAITEEMQLGAKPTFGTS